jgi:hypothetical protein
MMMGEDGEELKPTPVPIPRMVFDGKRMRKPIQRRTVDYGSPLIKLLEVKNHIIKLYAILMYRRYESL